MRSMLLAVLLTWGVAAQAALVDNGSFTTDTNSGLDWLDLSETAGLSVPDALSANAGWRYATNAEVEGLFAVAFEGFYSNCSADKSCLFGSPMRYEGHVEDYELWQSLFGIAPEPSFAISTGMYRDEGGNFRLLGTDSTSVSNTQIYGLDHDTNADLYALNGNRAFGTFLVRSSVIPIPAAVWLFGSALAGLGWLRRKQLR